MTKFIIKTYGTYLMYLKSTASVFSMWHEM